MAQQLNESSPDEMVLALQALVAAAGRGREDTSVCITTLIATLGHEDLVSYQTRADLYGAATELGASEISFLLLASEPDSGADNSTPTRPIAPGGPTLPLGSRKSAARSHHRQTLDHLRNDPHPHVVTILLDNPKVREQDVLFMASKRPGNSESLIIIAGHPKWLLRRSIRLAVALNPKTPPAIACRISLDLPDMDLRQIVGTASCRPLLRGHADRLLQRRRAWSSELTSGQPR